MPKRAGRAEDEIALSILAAGVRGGERVAQGHGLSASYARVLRQRVMADDLAASPNEDAGMIARFYGRGVA